MSEPTAAEPTGETGDRSPRSKAIPPTPLQYNDPVRKWASVTLLAAVVLLFVASNGPWWQTTLTASSVAGGEVEGASVVFHLGGTVTCTTFNWQPPNPCQNVSSMQAGWREALSEAINDGLTALFFACAAGWTLATLGNVGVRLGRGQLALQIALVLGVSFLAMGFLVTSVAIGPGPQAGSYCWAFSANVTTCPFFWGGSIAGVTSEGCALCINTLSWGAGVAFYETLGATVLTGTMGFLLWRGRKGPYLPAEEAAWARENAPLPIVPEPPPPSPTAPPSARVDAFTVDRPPISENYHGFRIAESPWTCPNCGAINSRWALQCGRCNAEMPPSGPPPGPTS